MGETLSLPLPAVAADPEIDRTRACILATAVDAGWRGLGSSGAAALAALVLLAGGRAYMYGDVKERLPAGGGGRSAKRPWVRRFLSVAGRVAARVRAATARRTVRIAGIRYSRAPRARGPRRRAGAGNAATGLEGLHQGREGAREQLRARRCGGVPPPLPALRVDNGDERRVERVDYRERTVHLEGPDGATVAWKPSEIGGRQGGTEVYRTETVELRAGDRIRWTRNDTRLGVVNSGAAEVLNIHSGRVTFALEDGRRLTLTPGDPQLRHLDRVRASTVHAFQGRTVDNVIAAMEANHPQLTTAKAFYVEISRARNKAELVTDDAQALRERLEAVTGERISALEGIGESVSPERERGHGKDREASQERERERPEASALSPPDREIEPEASRQKAPEPELPAKARVREMDLGL